MKNIRVLSENFQFLEVKCSIYLNRRVFVMTYVFIKIFFLVFPRNHTLLNSLEYL